MSGRKPCPGRGAPAPGSALRCCPAAPRRVRGRAAEAGLFTRAAILSRGAVPILDRPAESRSFRDHGSCRPWRSGARCPSKPIPRKPVADAEFLAAKPPVPAGSSQQLPPFHRVMSDDHPVPAPAGSRSPRRGGVAPGRGDFIYETVRPSSRQSVTRRPVIESNTSRRSTRPVPGSCCPASPLQCRQPPRWWREAMPQIG